MNTIGRLMKLFIGAVAMVAAFAVAPAATAAPGDGGDGGSPGATATQTQTVAQSLPSAPSVPGVSDLQDWADDALSNLPGSSDLPGQTPDQSPDPAPAPAPQPSPSPDQSPRPAPAPCAVEAKACINLGDQIAWLQDGNGNIIRGPVPMSSGKVGYETPRGTTQVTRKIVDEWSNTYDAPMPYSVYFSAGSAYPGDIGIAFHEGDPNVMSHGCIHLLHDDAVAFFNHLQVGDVVDVV